MINFEQDRANWGPTNIGADDMLFPHVQYVDRLSGGANGRNWPGFVRVKRDVPFRAAVVAQEAWESMHKAQPLRLTRRILGAFGILKYTKQMRRDMEYMGHEVECQVKNRMYGIPLGTARHQEAASMRRGYDGIFSHLSVEHIVREMAERQGDARRWVDKYYNQIKEHRE